MPAGKSSTYRIPVTISPVGATAGRVSINKSLKSIERQALITQAALGQLTLTLSGAGIAGTTAAGGLSAAALATAALGKTSKSAAAGTTAASAGVKKLGVSSVRVIPAIRSLVLVLGGVGIAIGGIVAINQIAKFEQAMASVRAVIGTTGEGFQRLTSLARHLGAVTVFTATQASEAQLRLARAGLSTQEILLSLPDTLSLARAGGLELAQATDITVSALRGFGIGAEETTRVTDVLALTAARTNTTIIELSEGLKFVAPVASQLGVSFEETAAAVGKLADAGLKSTIGGTGLRRVLSGLAKPTARAKQIFNSLDLSLQDLNVTTFGVTKVLTKLSGAGISAGQALEVFGLRGGPAFLVLQGITLETERLNRQLEDAEGFARNAAKIMDDTLSASLLRLNSAITEAFISLGDSGLRGSLRNITETATGTVTVWNDMIPAATAVGTVTEENVRKFEIWATSLEITGVALRGLIIAGVLIYIGKFLSLVGTAALKMKTMNIALTAVITVLSFASYVYVSHADKIQAAIQKYTNLENALRNVAGAANFTNLTFESLSDASKDRFATGFENTKVDTTKRAIGIIEEIGNAVGDEFKRLETLQGSTFFSDPRRASQTGGNSVVTGKIIADALKTAGISNLDSVSTSQVDDVLKGFAEGISDTPKEFAEATQQFFVELKKNVFPLLSDEQQGQFTRNIGASFSTDVDGNNLDLLDLVSQSEQSKRIAESLRNPRPSRKIRNKLPVPAEVRELFQLDKFDTSTQSDILDADELKNAGGRFGHNIRAQARILAQRETAIKFASLPQFEDGTLNTDEIIKNIVDYRDSESFRLSGPDGSIQQELAKKNPNFNLVEKLKSESAGITSKSNTAISLVPELSKLRDNFFDNTENVKAEEGLIKLNEQFASLRANFDGVGVATEQIEAAKSLLANAPDAVGTDATKAVAAFTAQLKEQKEPLETILEQENERAKLAGITSEAERDLIQVENELMTIRNGNISITKTETDAIKEKILVARQLARERADYINLIRQTSGNTFTREQADIRSDNINKAVDTGDLSGIRGAQQQAQLRLDSPLGDNSQPLQEFTDGFLANLQVIEEASIGTAERIGESLQIAVDTGIEGFSSIAAEAIVTGESATEAFRALGVSIVQTIIQSLIQIGVQYVVNSALAAVFGKTQVVANTAGAASSIAAMGAVTAAGIAQGIALTAAYTPAAVAAAIASYGAANAFGIQAQLLIAGSGIAGGAKSGVSSTGGAGINPGIGLADGGLVRGPGGPRSDSVPIRASNGEFVVNAESTKRNLPLLEAINGMGYASGGQVTGGGGGNNVTLDIKVNNQTPDPVRIEQRQDNLTGQIVLTIKEVLSGGVVDDELEKFGIRRQPD